MTDTPQLDLFVGEPTTVYAEPLGQPAPITIICGEQDHSVVFTADPMDGTITVSQDTFADELVFDIVEFGLIAALLVRVAEGV